MEAQDHPLGLLQQALLGLLDRALGLVLEVHSSERPGQVTWLITGIVLEYKKIRGGPGQ